MFFLLFQSLKKKSNDLGFCLRLQVTPDAQPFMGPNFYMTPPASFTHFHQDGHGTVDSGHLCISGYNEVIMLRRLTERHKKHALWILSGKQRGGSHFDGLYSMPHGDNLVGRPFPICSFSFIAVIMHRDSSLEFPNTKI